MMKSFLKSSFDEENIHSKERTINDDLQRKYESKKCLMKSNTWAYQKINFSWPGIKEFISKINSIADIYILTVIR